MKLLKLLLLGFSLVACQKKTPFPTEETTRFLKECADNAPYFPAPKALQTNCLCALDGIQAQYTYEQYTVMGGVKFPSTVFLDMQYVHLNPQEIHNTSDPAKFMSASNAPELRAVFQACADKNWPEFDKEYAVELPKMNEKFEKENKEMMDRLQKEREERQKQQ